MTAGLPMSHYISFSVEKPYFKTVRDIQKEKRR
jgi:hypothetical protein